MDEIGIIKQFDKLGRVVIPKDLRDRYLHGNNVKIIATRSGILLKDPDYVLVKNDSASKARQG